MYGDGGSMMGSGIYSEDYTGFFYCRPCDDEFELDGTTDDWKSTAYAECPRCKSELEKDISNEGPDEYDRADEAWKDRD